MGDYDFGFGDVASNLDLPEFGGLNLGGPEFDVPNLSLGADVIPSGNFGIPAGDYSLYGGGPGQGIGAGDYSLFAGTGRTAPEVNLTAPTAGGGGLMDTLGGVASKLLPAAQLGLAGLGAYQGVRGAMQSADQQSLLRQQQRQQGRIGQQQQQIGTQAQAAAEPVFQGGREAFDRAMRGEVPAAVQAQIDEWTRGAKQYAQAQAAGSGQGRSTQLAQWLAWIDQQAQAMKGSWIKSQMDYALSSANAGGQLLGTGAQALGGAANTTTAGANTAAQQQNELNALIGAANRVLAGLNASTGRG